MNFPFASNFSGPTREVGLNPDNGHLRDEDGWPGLGGICLIDDENQEKLILHVWLNEQCWVPIMEVSPEQLVALSIIFAREAIYLANHQEGIPSNFISEAIIANLNAQLSQYVDLTDS